MTKKVQGHQFKKIVLSGLRLLGFFLVLAGIVVLVWIGRPYFALFFSSSQRQALEEKIKLNKVAGNHIIIPSVLVDAEILEGATRKNFERGVVRLPNSGLPGEKKTIILEGHNLAEFGLWQPRSFFSLLDVIRKDAKIYIYYNGRKYVYKVKEKKRLKLGDPDLPRVNNQDELKLITCVSTWSLTIYTDWRTVVIAEPVSNSGGLRK